MSSSANRRPRVAGQRRRPPREGSPVVLETPDGVPEHEGVVATDVEDREEGELRREEPMDREEGEEREPTAAVAAGGARSVRLPAIALALCLALLATVLVVTRHDPEERARAAAAATATARSTLEQALSYNYATMTAQLPATQALLTGSFRQEFGETMTKTIVPLAEKDKTVVKARVYEAGVMSQTDDTVTVQAFVNQAKTSDAQKDPSIDQNRVIATMTKVGNRWLVSQLKAY